MVQIKIKDGILEGGHVDNEYGGKFYSFKGIPYAAPPVGNLRFKAPQPVKPWDGVRKATEFGSICTQYNLMLAPTMGPSGSEDCLYINVYTPDIKPNKPLPVMVFIHGGAFVSGSGNDDMYGPEFLVRHGVILVTFNYRLEALGFLCLDTEEIPGNAGMKDQVAALRWVKNNINNFGGDPNNITIFGESAGGASVSFHLISPMSKGLFQRAIVQSGCAFNPWPIPFQPRERALVLARKLGFESEDEKELNDFFKSVPVESLIGLQLPTIMSETQKGDLFFGIVDEKQFGSNERFFYGDVYETTRNGVHDGIEVMIGYTNDEGLMMLTKPNAIPELPNKIKNFADYFVPKQIQQNCKLADQIEASKSIKNFYYGREFPNEENWMFTKEALDFEQFNYGLLQWAKFCANQKIKTYFYKFTCVTERNVFAHLLGIGKYIGNRTVVCHADDLSYLFPSRIIPNQSIKDSTMKIIDKVTKLWTNFAKFGNPTPDKSLGVQWAPFTLQKQEYMNIGNDLSAGENPDKEEAEFWENLHKKYVPHQLVN